MPFGAVAGGLAAGIGGSLVSGLMAPGTSGGSSSLYIPTGLGPEDQQWQNLQNQLYGTYQGQGLQQYGLDSLTAGINLGNAYGPGYQNAANAAGNQYGQLGQTLGQQATQNYGTQQQLLNAGNQVYQMGLDPNRAQYDLSLNNLQQQTGATNSMYGLGSSGAGAGVQNQALSNFGINWNTQQLANAATGLSAYDQAANQAAQYGQLANQQGAAAPGYTLQGGQLPYQTAQTQAALPGQLGNVYGQYLNQNVYGPGQQLQNQAQNYLSYGSGLNTTAFNNANQNAGALGSTVAQGISGLGNAYQNAGSLGNLFGGTTGSFGGGNFGGAFSSNPYYSGGGNSYGFTMQ